MNQTMGGDEPRRTWSSRIFAVFKKEDHKKDAGQEYTEQEFHIEMMRIAIDVAAQIGIVDYHLRTGVYETITGEKEPVAYIVVPMEVYQTVPGEYVRTFPVINGKKFAVLVVTEDLLAVLMEGVRV